MRFSKCVTLGTFVLAASLGNVAAATASPFSSGLAGVHETPLAIIDAHYYGRRGGWSFGFSYGDPGGYGYGYAPGPWYGYPGYVGRGYRYRYRGYPAYRRYYAPDYDNHYRRYRKERTPGYPNGYGDS